MKTDTSTFHFSGLSTLSLVALVGWSAGCADRAILPPDYADSYVEVRDCRQSGDHDLHMIRVLTDPGAATAYVDRSEPFPIGSIVVKEEYDFGDTDCSGDIVAWTVMEKLEPPATMLGWYWQTIEPGRVVTRDNPVSCSNCHRGCGNPPDGYDGTCTVP